MLIKRQIKELAKNLKTPEDLRKVTCEGSRVRLTKALHGGLQVLQR